MPIFVVLVEKKPKSNCSVLLGVILHPLLGYLSFSGRHSKSVSNDKKVESHLLASEASVNLG